jgi:hypothetical protein
MVDGNEKPILNKVFITVPDGPGLGIPSLNQAVIRQPLGTGLFRTFSAVKSAPIEERSLKPKLASVP